MSAAAGTTESPNPSRTPSQKECQDLSDNSYHSLSDAYQSYLRKDTDEQAHWDDVCRAYRQYAAFAVKQFGLNHPNRLAGLPATQQAVLPKHLQYGSAEFVERLKLFKAAAVRNQFCLDCILRHAGEPHSQQAGSDGKFATEAQLSRVSSVLKSLARDWSSEGQAERDMAYLPILQSVKTYLPNTRKHGAPKICVPGAGVGRLACELAAANYTVQGNEFSLYMLLASDFILNGPVVTASGDGKQPLSISPWLLETRNVRAATDPLRSVQIPNVDPFAMVASTRSCDDDSGDDNEGLAMTESKSATDNEVPPRVLPREPSNVASGADFSMAAGDFGSIYSVDSEASAWDCVVACFFLDASPSIIEYLQVVHHMLKPGGILVSFGPLHWHWSGPAMLLADGSVPDYNERYSYLDSKYLHSYDFCWEDIAQILVNLDFEVLESRADIPSLYTADQRSMLRSEYRCVHFVARKNEAVALQQSNKKESNMQKGEATSAFAGS